MKKKVIIVVIILIICIVIGIFAYNRFVRKSPIMQEQEEILASFKNNAESIKSIKVTVKKEDYRGNAIDCVAEINDKDLIEKIENAIFNEKLEEFNNLKLAFEGIFKVDLGNNASFEFDNYEDEDGYIELTKNGKTIITKVDPMLLFEICEEADREYRKTLTVYDSFKANKIEIYTYAEKYTMYNEITDEAKVDEGIKVCKNLELQPMGVEAKEPELVKTAYYEFRLGVMSTFYIDENFENAILDSSFLNSEKPMRYFEVNNPEALKGFIPKANSNENFRIMEASIENKIGEDVKIELSVKDESLSSSGISLRIYMENTEQAERYRNNDFIIYKDNNGSWEELQSQAAIDKNIVTKSKNELIDWTEKYGKLGAGVYKLERSLFFGETRGSIDGEVENKYYIVFEIK